jgi:signal transduction histidine kinase/HAMP domain-containing protein
MQPTWRRSILYLTAFQVIGIAVLVGLIFVSLTSYITDLRTQRQFSARLGELLETVENTAQIACFTKDRVLAAELANGLIKNSEVLGVVISSGSEELTRNFKPLARQSSLKQAKSGRLVKQIASPFDPAEIVGEILLEPNPETYDELILENVSFVALLLGLQLVIVVAAVLAVVLLRVVRPIKGMSDGLHRMGTHGNKMLRLPRGQEDTEIGRLALDINHLTTTLIAAHDEEHALRLQRELDERKYHAIFDNADSGIFIASADGRLESWNHALGRQFRIPVYQDAHANLTTLNWRPQGRLAALLQTCLAENTPQAEDIEFLPEQDTPRWFNITLTPIGNNQAQGLVNDISRRKQAEEDIRKALAQQQELYQLKSRFVSMTSHEFRTPLSAISSSSELLRDYYDRLDTQERADLFRNIGEGVERMIGMLDNMLIIGKADADKAKFFPDLLNLEQFCRSIASEAEAALKAASTRPALNLVFDATRESVMLDQKLLRQILGNLLSNALKYSPNGGRVDFIVRENDGEASFVVADQGIGIPADELPHLFESFHRAHNVGNIPGTGLGLAIVKKSVEMHGGSIAVDSATGQGTRFTVIIPIPLPAESEVLT